MSERPGKIFLFTPNWNHISRNSGFNPLVSRLCEESNYYRAVNLATPTFFRPLERILAYLRHHSGFSYTLRYSIWSQIALIWISIYIRIWSPRSLVIFLASENQGSFLARVLIPFQYIAVFHQPPDWLNTNPEFINFFKYSAYIICLSDYQRNYLSTLVKAPMVSIKHGVTTSRFKPNLVNFAQDSSSESNPYIVLVGKHLRDDHLSIDVINNLLIASNDLDFKIFSPSKLFYSLLTESKLSNSKRLIIYENVPEFEYLYFLKNALLSLLCLQDSTANNALLESLSSGVPVVATSVGAVSEYDHLPGLYVVEPHSSLICSIILELYCKLSSQSPESTKICKECMHNTVLNTYSWDVLTSSYDDVFRYVLSTQPTHLN